MAHLPPSTSAACGGRPCCCLPDEMFGTKISDLYTQQDFEATTRPLNRGRSSG
jgi:hypothetical protein